MFGIFKRVKRLEHENAALKEVIRSYETPVGLNVGLTAMEWNELTEAEKSMRIRKLDLILTLKKTGRWDYVRNCAQLEANS